MQNFTAHLLRFVLETTSTVELNEHQGSAIRGALYHAMRDQFCGNRKASDCDRCPIVETCPVAYLVNTLNPRSHRGRNIPRPYTVQPPLPGQGGHPTLSPDGHLRFRYYPGERFEFGLTLFAQALHLFPYIILTLDAFRRRGLGRKVKQEDGQWKRGGLALREAWAENPLTGQRVTVLHLHEKSINVPDIPITHHQVLEVARRMPKEARVRIRLLTPTRLVAQSQLVKPKNFHFQPFFQRLMERLEALSRHFSDTPLLFDDPRGLIAAAGKVEIVEKRLRWEELRSYSTRRRAASPISGLIGDVIFHSKDWSPFWPWLLWGQFTHVGKNAVKGDGWYTIEEVEEV